jgi:hypothetical protein
VGQAKQKTPKLNLTFIGRILRTIVMLSLFTPTKKQIGTQLFVVRLHAEWCDNSKGLNTLYNNLKNRFDGEEVLFITLDFTNNTTKHQSQLLALAIGVFDTVANYSETGQLLLVTARGKNVVKAFTKEQSFQEVETFISHRLK